MTGYINFSQSVNSFYAKKEERYPLTLAAKVFAKKTGWTIEKSKAFLKTQESQNQEYHHVSKFYNEVFFYDVSDNAIADLQHEMMVFVFEEPLKKEKKLFFKCWNIWEIFKDPRKLDFSISNRESKHNHEINSVLADISKSIKIFETKILESNLLVTKNCLQKKIEKLFEVENLIKKQI